MREQLQIQDASKYADAYKFAVAAREDQQIATICLACLNCTKPVDLPIPDLSLYIPLIIVESEIPREYSLKCSQGQDMAKVTQKSLYMASPTTPIIEVCPKFVVRTTPRTKTPASTE